MRCPFCGNEDTKVVDSRAYSEGSSIKRRRECPRCDKRFTTYEKIEDTPLYIVKRSGGRELFNRDKVFRGLMLATIKRDIAMDKLVGLVSEVEQVIRSNMNQEIKSSELGDLILKKLVDIDEVAYVRFASVYKDFQDIRSFVEIVEQVKEGR